MRPFIQQALTVTAIAAFLAYRTYTAAPTDQGMSISGKADLTKIMAELM